MSNSDAAGEGDDKNEEEEVFLHQIALQFSAMSLTSFNKNEYPISHQVADPNLNGVGVQGPPQRASSPVAGLKTINEVKSLEFFQRYIQLKLQEIVTPKLMIITGCNQA